MESPALSVNKAFSKQSDYYDLEDAKNKLLQRMRAQVYEHVEKFIKPSSNILELNAGTGIDALHFISKGHCVHATDLSDGMIHQIKNKIQQHNLSGKLSVQQISYENLDAISAQKFDYIFSNFGGLNCVDNLERVTRHLPALLHSGGYVTFVIMPVICPWELMSVVRHGLKALRRLKKDGAIAHLEGEHFKTYYHSLSRIKKSFNGQFQFVECEGLSSLTPPPHRPDFADKHPSVFKFLSKLDNVARKQFPFNRWADHIIVTFQFFPEPC